MPYFINARRSAPQPKANPDTFSGSYFTKPYKLGSIMPQPNNSTHPVRLQTGQPDPPHSRQLMSNSPLGSVNGKKLGRKRVRTLGPKKRRMNSFNVPFRSHSEMWVSTAKHSI